VRTESPNIDRADLCRRIGESWGFSVTACEFVPKGEVAFNYVVTGADGSRAFARVQETADRHELEQIYRCVDALQRVDGSNRFVAPHRRRRGGYLLPLGHFTVALFPFLSGRTAFEAPRTEPTVVQSASLIAGLHRATRTLPILPPRQEVFGNPFADTIGRLLSRVKGRWRPEFDHQRDVRKLLIDCEEEIREAERRLARLGTDVCQLKPDAMLTHGDPNWANILVDEGGAPHLIDWEDVAFGPPERDLAFFTDEFFEPFLRQYVEIRGPVRLRRSAFGYYQYRWMVQEIADWSTRLLFELPSSTEAAHAWSELTQYLPAPFDTIERGLDEVVETIHRVS